MKSNNCLAINQTQYGEKPFEGILDAELLKKIAKVKDEPDLNNDGKSRQVSLALGELGYASRGLCISKPSDVVFLPKFLEDRFSWIYEHYCKCGLNPTQNIIWNEDLAVTGKFVKNYPNFEPLFYMFADKAHEFFPNQKRLEATKLANSKNGFMQLCNSLGVVIPETKCFTKKSELAELNELNYPVYLKSDVSVAGYGVVRCCDEQELEKALINVSEKVRFQIQEEVSDVVSSVNVQYLAQNGVSHRLAITEQILEDGKYHVGNRFPAEIAPWGATDGIAYVLARLGVEGIYAFDVVVDKKGKAFVIECNPRFNGASTPTLVAESINAHEWRAVTLKYHNDLNRVDFGNALFNPKTNKGAVVITWGIENKLGILIVGNYREQIQIESELKAFL